MSLSDPARLPRRRRRCHPEIPHQSWWYRNSRFRELPRRFRRRGRPDGLGCLVGAERQPCPAVVGRTNGRPGGRSAPSGYRSPTCIAVAAGTRYGGRFGGAAAGCPRRRYACTAAPVVPNALSPRETRRRHTWPPPVTRSSVDDEVWAPDNEVRGARWWVRLTGDDQYRVTGDL